jgi:hypothetical protein
MPESSIMNALMDVIADRKNNPPADPSYVVKLLRGGIAEIGAKIVEAAVSISSRRPPTLCFTLPSCWATMVYCGARWKPSWRGDLGSAASPKSNRGVPRFRTTDAK